METIDCRHQGCRTIEKRGFFSGINVSHLTLRNLIVRNPDSYHIRACRLRDFTFEDIGFDDSSLRPNMDGIHLNGFCENGVIRRIRACSANATNDDMVALNADDGFDASPQLDMTDGPIRHIKIDHLRAASTYTFVRMLSYRSPIEDIAVNDIAGGARLNVLNMDRWRFPKGGGNIHDITLSHFNVRRAADASKDNAINIPLLTVQVAVHGLEIEGFDRTAGDPSVSPTLIVGDGRPLRLKLEGLTEKQMTGMLKASPALTRKMFRVTRTVDGTKSFGLSESGQSGLATLPGGGFSLLTVDSVAP